MYESRVVFGERAVLFSGAPLRLPCRVLLPGPGVTVRQRVEAAVDPAGRSRAAEAAARLGVSLAVQDPVDVPAEARLCPPSSGECAHAAAMLELGAWRYRLAHCPPGFELARLLADRPDEFAPAPGMGAVVGGTLTLSRRSTHGTQVAPSTAGGPGTAGASSTAGAPGTAGGPSAPGGPSVRDPGAAGAAGDGAGPVDGVVLSVPGGAAPADPGWANIVLDSVVARERLISHLRAEQYRDIAALSAGYPGIHQFLATELALALHITDAEAARLLGDAEHLRDRTPDTLEALSAGRIDESKAIAIIRGTTTCTPAVARRVEQRVLPQAPGITAVAVRRRTTRAVIAEDPDGAADRHRRARADRYVSRRPEPDGMASITIHAPAPDVATIWDAVTACADAVRRPGDTRPLAARRVDALTQICADILSGGGWSGLRLPDTGRHRPRIAVTVPYTVLLGHRAPCELAGHGPICTEQALQLIGTGDLCRLLTDPVTGHLLNYGRTRYRPPPHLADFVKTRDGECPMPSCHQGADRAPIDHVVPAKPDPVTGLPTLGRTDADNLAPPCPHHHNGKDAGRGFSLHRARDGTYTWRTPLGRVYTWRPDPLWHSETDPVPDDVPVCGCPQACACQQPAPADPDIPALTTGDDWADGFLADQRTRAGDPAGHPGGDAGGHAGGDAGGDAADHGAVGSGQGSGPLPEPRWYPGITDHSPPVLPMAQPCTDDHPDEPPF